MEESIDVNQIVKKVEASVKDKGWITIQIFGYTTKDARERKIRGINLTAYVTQDPAEFDYSKSSRMHAIDALGKENIRFSYTEEDVNYNTELSLSELPTHFATLLKTPVAEELREFVSKRLEMLKRRSEYKKDELKKVDEEFNTLNQFTEQTKTK